MAAAWYSLIHSFTCAASSVTPSTRSSLYTCASVQQPCLRQLVQQLNTAPEQLHTTQVAPIISVLLTSLMKAPVKKAATTLARVSKLPLQTMSQGLERLSRPLGKTSRPLGKTSRPLEGADRCVWRGAGGAGV